MEYKDYSTIESIKFSHPEFMATDAEDKAKALFEEIQKETLAIASLRSEANSREAILYEKKRLWNELKSQMAITYKTLSKKEIKNESGLFFKMSAEINKNVH